MSNIVIIENHPTLESEESAILKLSESLNEMSELRNFEYAKYVFNQQKTLLNLRLDCSKGEVVVKDGQGNSISEDIHKFGSEQIMSVLFCLYFPKCHVSKLEQESGVLNERLFAIIVGDSSVCCYTLIKTYSLQEIEKSLSAFNINRVSLLKNYKVSMPLFNQKFVEYTTSKNKKVIKKAVFEFLDDKGKLLRPIATFANRKDFGTCKQNVFDLRKSILENPDVVKKAISGMFNLVKQFTPRGILLEEWRPTLTDRVQKAKNSGINTEYDEYLLELTQEFLGNENIKYEIVTE